MYKMQKLFEYKEKFKTAHIHMTHQTLKNDHLINKGRSNFGPCEREQQPIFNHLKN